MYKVSVIIPVYKAAAYIERCARMLFDQSLPDVEYIFVDDASPDRSMEILAKVAESYPLLRDNLIIEHLSTNCGQHIARQRGIELARGEYIIHCDPDDCLRTKTALEELYNTAVQNDADMVWFDLTIIENREERHISMKEKTDKVSLIRRHLRDMQFMGSLCNRLVRKEIVKNPTIIYPKTRIIEDLVLVMQYTALARNIVYLPKSYYNYYRYAGSTTDNTDSGLKILKRMQTVEPNVRIIENFIKDNLKLGKTLRNDILINKFNYKLRLIPYIQQTKDMKSWRKLYPEINLRLLFSPCVSLHNKALHCLMLTGLYKYFH